MFSSFDLNPTGDKRAMPCEGCGLFASCEILDYLNGDKMQLCGNCHQFIEKFAKKIIDSKLPKKELKKMLGAWRDNKKGFNFDIDSLFTEITPPNTTT
ncbi:MAG: hypothetical protein WC307_06570 [Candidatus Nanoarchaeia archaeon]|jgi:hypothetical protein